MPARDDRAPRPLTPATFHILVSLTHGPAHGYEIKRLVEERTRGAVLLGAGTLYAGLRRMSKNGLIAETEPPAEALETEPSSRWRFYEITDEGTAALAAEMARLESDLEAARAAVNKPA